MIEAPIGAGVYEVRHTRTGHVIASESARSVARVLSELKFGSKFLQLFRRQSLVSPVSYLARQRTSPMLSPPRTVCSAYDKSPGVGA